MRPADPAIELRRACERALATAARTAAGGTRQQARAAARRFVRRHRHDEARLREALRIALASASLAAMLVGLAPGLARGHGAPLLEPVGAGPLAAIDVGDRSAPAAADLDADGDPDLLVGSADGTFTWLENTGSAAVPAFTERVGAANPLDGLDIGDRAAPAFGDLDGDGDPDLVTGGDSGVLYYFENVGDATSPSFTERTGSANPFSTLAQNPDAKPVLVDLDADGDLDLTVADRYGGFRWFENTGDRSAPAFVERTGSANPFDGLVGLDVSLALGDADADGDADLVVGGVFGAFVWLRNAGTAEAAVFEQLTLLANPLAITPPGPYSTPAFLDLDGDGDLDVVSGQGDGTLAVYESRFGEIVGFETLAVSTPPAFPYTGPFAFGDLDTDGDTDIVYAPYDLAGGTRELFVLTNSGSPTLPDFDTVSPVVGTSPFPFGGHDLGDVDGDGDLDLAVVRFGVPSVADNVGGPLTPVFSYLTGPSDPFGGVTVTAGLDVCLGDLDGDSDLDALVSDATGTLTFFEKTGAVFSSVTGPTSPVDGIDVTTTPLEVGTELGDLDDDGDLDLLVSTTDVSVPAADLHYFENTGTRAAPSFVERTGGDDPFDPFSFFLTLGRMADLDGDGDQDVVFAIQSSASPTPDTLFFGENAMIRPAVSAYELTGGASPLYSSHVDYDARVATGDLDGDGDADVVAGQADGALRYFENVGSATRPLHAEVTGGANPFAGIDVGSRAAPELGDLDADGDLDLVVGHDGGLFRYYENTGAPLAPAFVERTGAANPFDGQTSYVRSTPRLGDLDRDGDLDLVAGGYGGRLWYFQNTGTATAPVFQAVTTVSSPFYFLQSGYYGAPALGDVDRDGDLDLVVGQATGDIRTFENVGTPATFVELTADDDPFAGEDVGDEAVGSLADLYGDGHLAYVAGDDGGDFHVYKLPEPRGPLVWVAAGWLLRRLAGQGGRRRHRGRGG